MLSCNTKSTHFIYKHSKIIIICNNTYCNLYYVIKNKCVITT